MLNTLDKILSRWHFKIFFLFFPENGFWNFMHLFPMETIFMKFQNPFSGENKKNINNVSSAELAQRVEKVKISQYLG